jgi:hypothetical protein
MSEPLSVCAVCRRPTPEPAGPGVIVMHAECSRRAHLDALRRLRFDAAGHARLAPAGAVVAAEVERLIAEHGPQTLGELAGRSGRSEHGVRGAISHSPHRFRLEHETGRYHVAR